MLFAGGVAGGILASLVGGASLITFPVLLAAGLPPIIATASNQAAVLPANVIASVTDRALMPPLNRGFVGLIAASMLGTVAGSALLLLTPQRVFEILVPLLLGFATLLFAFSSPISNWLRERARARGKPELKLSLNSIPTLLVCVYGGYFGAGVGVLLLAVLSIANPGDYRTANAVKNLVGGITTAGAVAYLGAAGAISWAPTSLMMAGALLGGLAGGYLARVVPQEIMRVAVVAVGVLLTVVYAWRYWF